MNRFFTIILLCIFSAGTSFSQADLRVADVFPGPYLRPGTYPFTPSNQNIGSQGTPFKLYWQLNNGPVKNVVPFTPPAIAGNSIVMKILSDSFKITVTTPGLATLKVWIKTTGTVVDPNHANDTFVRTFKVMSNLPDKNVVLEVYKHQACGPCYPAAEFNCFNLEPLPHYSLVSLYTAVGDVLYSADADNINDLYGFAHPAPVFDRFRFPYRTSLDVNYYTFGNDYLLEENGKRDICFEPLGVSIASMSIDMTTRILKVRLKATAVDTISGDLRFNLWLTEDSLKAYQASAPNPNDYWHSHVLRAFVGGKWGVQGSVPAVMYPGQEATYDFQYTVPANYKLKDMTAIGLVQVYNADIFSRRIINSVRAKATTKLSIAGLPSLQNIRIFPNPVTDKLQVHLGDDVKPEGLTIRILSHTGKIVLLQDVHSRTESLEVSGLPAASYQISVSGSEGSVVYPFVKLQ